jgi:hypothetical protein
MIRSHALPLVLTLVLGGAAAAQQRPIFDPDDFLDPREREGTFFVSRLVAGGARSYIDDFRPASEDVAFLHVTNSVYWKGVQFDYKHSEVFAENGPPDVILCGCSGRDNPIYFPTPPPGDATPNPPPPGPKDTLQFGHYLSWGRSADGVPVTLRYRLTYSHQKIERDVVSAATGETSRLSGKEQSFGFETDTRFRIAGRDLFGSLIVSRSVRSGTPEDRSQTSIVHVSRFPAVAWKRVLFRATLTAGGVSGRGSTALNVVHPAFEAFWHDHYTRANFHLIYSPQTLRSGTGGWNMTHQIAVFVDRVLFTWLSSKATPTAGAPPE